MIYTYLSLLFATGFGVGYSPVAPGTCGSVVGVLCYVLCFLMGVQNTHALVVLLPLSIITAHHAGIYYKEADNQRIVIDEIAGYFVTMLAAQTPFLWYYLVLGFILFRLFDIIKIWPASFFDKRVKNGFGVVMDDVMAGLQAALVLRISAYFF